jgi:hypothetical protein
MDDNECRTKSWPQIKRHLPPERVEDVALLRHLPRNSMPSREEHERYEGLIARRIGEMRAAKDAYRLEGGF